MMYEGHQPVQHLVCFQHNEPIKGVCLWTGKCNERFMCRTCRRFHDSAHLNSYEEWDDLRNQNLIMDLKNEFDGISEKIEKQNVTYDENIRFIRSQIEYLFKEIQTHILHKLTQTRDTLISNINKKVDKNNVTQHKLRNSLIDVNRTYEKAFNTNFSNLNLAEDMVRAICNAQNLRDTTNNDPELQSKETISFSVNHLANANLFQHIKMSLDQVCQDVANSFVVDNTGKLPSVPKGSLLQSGMFPAQEDQNLISSLDMRSTEPFGSRDMNYDRGYQGGGGYGGYRQNENVMPRLSPFNKATTQGDTMGQEKSTPNRLLKIFENANQEEGGERTRMRGEMLEYRDRIVTSHKTIMYGGLLYIPLKRHLVTAGMEGAIEILKTGNGNMESLHTFKAHNGEVLRIQYIPEKNVLLSSGMDNKICVWDYHQKCKLLHTFTRHAGPVYAMEYLPDQDLVISGGEDEVIRMWNVNTCREHHTLKTANAKISSICRLEKQKRIAVGFDKGNVSIFATGQLKKNLFNIRAHNTYVFNVAAIPEQNLLLTSADDGLKVWRLLETKADFMRKFTQEGSMLRSFLVFQDKDLLLTNTDQNQIKIWKLSTGQKLGQYNDKTFGESMVSLPDQDEIATANLNEVKRWAVNY